MAISLGLNPIQAWLFQDFFVAVQVASETGTDYFHKWITW